MKEIEFKIKGLMMDPLTNSPIVVLQDTTSETLLPIWVGIFEANAIALQIEKVDTPRPMTHDLIKGMLNHLNARVTKIVVTELKDNTFYALIFLNVEGSTARRDKKKGACDSSEEAEQTTESELSARGKAKRKKTEQAASGRPKRGSKAVPTNEVAKPPAVSCGSAGAGI